MTQPKSASETLSSAFPAFAADPIQQQNSNAIWFENWASLTNATLTVATPNGEIINVFAASGTPVFKLEGWEIMDGIYRYEMNAATPETKKTINKVDNGRGDASRDATQVAHYSSGSFVVSRGVIIRPKEVKEDDG